MKTKEYFDDLSVGDYFTYKGAIHKRIKLDHLSENVLFGDKKVKKTACKTWEIRRRIA